MRSRHDRRSLSRPLLEALEPRTLLSVCLVDRLTDTGGGSGLAGDLRYCIAQAQDGDSIQFSVAGRINLNSALPLLTRSISIEGPGSDLVTVRMNCCGFRSFVVANEVAASISGLTISGFGNQGSVYNAGVLNISDTVIADGFGSAIYNLGVLTVIRSLMANHRSNDAGGGVSNSGTASIIDSRIMANDGYRGGGGLFNSGEMTITGSTVSLNVSSDVGGGVRNSGTLSITDTTVSGNRVAFTSLGGGGGGLANNGIMVMSSSTISGNAAPSCGGLDLFGNGSTLTVNNSTISGNQTAPIGADTTGGGVCGRGSTTLAISNSTITRNEARNGSGGGVHAQGTTLSMRNTIIADNTARLSPDLLGSLAAAGHNLIGNSAGGSGFDKTDLLDVDPLLGPLQDNGGPTRTHALLPGSPAIDAGDNTDAPEWDQRGEGFGRLVGVLDPKNPVIDMGAYEVQAWEGGNPSPGSGILSERPLRFDLTALMPSPLSHLTSRTSGDNQPSAMLVDAAFSDNTTDVQLAAVEASWYLSEYRKIQEFEPGAPDHGRRPASS